MRSLRCDACGAKALMAASKCPKCGHGFEVRDGSGELLPLAHCSTCDSYYPLRQGSCRWCATKPERAPVALHVWKGVGVAGLGVLAVVAWLVRDGAPPSWGSPARLYDPILTIEQTRPQSTARPRDPAPATPSIARTDTAYGTYAADAATPVNPTTVAVAASTTPDPAGVLAQHDSSAMLDTATPPTRSAAKSTPARSTAAKSAPARSAARSASPKAAPRSTKRAVWVSSVARDWVVVRADANRKARIIASIGPGTRVQLGELRGSWRRLKVQGIAGWVEHRLFAVRSGGARKVGPLAAR
jgi:hypothetical protein